MQAKDVLLEAHSRIAPLVHGVLTTNGKPIGDDLLTGRLDPAANTVAWLIWHLTRVQDDHVADVIRQEQVWTAGGWVERFDLPFEAGAHGYGQDAEQVGQVRVPAQLLLDYHDAVAEVTRGYLATLTDADLDRVVDEAWDPPVTLGVRLVSVVDDDLEHVGQAAFLRGVLERTRS
jgi:hypothetical protein